MSERFQFLEFEKEEKKLVEKWEKELKLEDYIAKAAEFSEKRGKEFFLKGEWRRALSYFHNLRTYYPEQSHSWKWAARCLIRDRAYEEAALRTERALTLFPQEPELMAARGVALAYLKKTKLAFEYSDAALTTPTAYILVCRAELLLTTKNEEEAPACIVRALEGNAPDPCLLLEISLIFYQFCYYQNALFYLSRLMTLIPATPFILTLTGLAQEQLGFTEQAEMLYNQALDLDPLYPLAKEKKETMKKPSFFSKLGSFFTRR